VLQGIKDYTKCAIENKFVIGSYMGIGLAYLIKYVENETGIKLPIIDDLLLYASSAVLGSTKLGAETYKAYRKMRNHIKEYDTIDQRFKGKFSSFYCTQKGIKLAAKEGGLEHLI
jgi:hypothetical protein